REYGWRGNAAKQENGGSARHPWNSPKFICLAKHRPALAETEARGRTLCLRANRCAATADGVGWGRRISQIVLAAGHCCTAGLRSGLCWLRVIFVRSARSRCSRHVRFTSKRVQTLAPQRNDATCHEPTHAVQQITFSTRAFPARGEL